MTITHITVSAGRTFNHPYERFSNLRNHVQLEASLNEMENPDYCAKGLLAIANKLADEDRDRVIDVIESLNTASTSSHEVAGEVGGMS